MTILPAATFQTAPRAMIAPVPSPVEASSDCLDTIKAVSELVLNVVTTLAIVIGGWWAWWRFGRERTDEWNLQVTINPSVLPYTEGERVLMVDVALKNIGKVKLSSGKRGCRFSVYGLAGNAPIGHEPDVASTICEDVDILAPYAPEPYWLEPGAEYHEPAVVVVPAGQLLLLKVAFWNHGDQDAITEYRVLRSESEQAIVTSTGPGTATSGSNVNP